MKENFATTGSLCGVGRYAVSGTCFANLLRLLFCNYLVCCAISVRFAFQTQQIRYARNSSSLAFLFCLRFLRLFFFIFLQIKFLLSEVGCLARKCQEKYVAALGISAAVAQVRFWCVRKPLCALVLHLLALHLRRVRHLIALRLVTVSLFSGKKKQNRLLHVPYPTQENYDLEALIVLARKMAPTHFAARRVNLNTMTVIGVPENTAAPA